MVPKAELILLGVNLHHSLLSRFISHRFRSDFYITASYFRSLEDILFPRFIFYLQIA
jgi:hypothetical protein